MSTDPNPDRLDDLRTEYASTGMVTSDGAVWLFSQVVVLREQLDRLSALPAAAPVAVPPADRAGLRDWIADAVVPLLLDTLPKVIARARGYEVADAVLALLPADSEPHRLALSDALGLGTSAPWDAIRERAAELHNGAGTPQPETQAAPRRGDAVEQWLKTQRDEYEVRSSPQWGALNEVLDTYRLHADTGTPLGEHVCEGRAVGDCECLEKPAATPSGKEA